jgi:hypothetical protein
LQNPALRGFVFVKMFFGTEFETLEVMTLEHDFLILDDFLAAQDQSKASLTVLQTLFL